MVETVDESGESSTKKTSPIKRVLSDPSEFGTVDCFEHNPPIVQDLLPNVGEIYRQIVMEQGNYRHKLYFGIKLSQEQ